MTNTTPTDLQARMEKLDHVALATVYAAGLQLGIEKARGKPNVSVDTFAVADGAVRVFLDLMDAIADERRIKADRA